MHSKISSFYIFDINMGNNRDICKTFMGKIKTSYSCINTKDCEVLYSTRTKPSFISSSQTVT